MKELCTPGRQGEVTKDIPICKKMTEKDGDAFISFNTVCFSRLLPGVSYFSVRPRSDTANQGVWSEPSNMGISKA